MGRVGAVLREAQAERAWQNAGHGRLAEGRHDCGQLGHAACRVRQGWPVIRWISMVTNVN